MSRKKSRLQLQKPKRRRVSWPPGGSIAQECKGVKRKFQKTPSKSLVRPSIRSPYRSPLFKASPALKKQKRSIRLLFQSSGITGETDVWPGLETLRNESLFSNNSGKLGEVTEVDNGEVDEIVQQRESNVPIIQLVDNDLDEKEDRSSVETELADLLPSVVKHLAQENRLDLVLLTFFKQVKDNAFPLDNIAFLLWCEVVRWFDCKTTTQMRYSTETKTFWKLGYRLFGERFVNFMSGPKSHGEIILNVSEGRRYCPESSDINFAVPNPKVLRCFDPYIVGGERQPGIFLDIINLLSNNLNNKKSACLTFDGKKIKQGLTDNSGDVDLLGFEKDLTLREKKGKLDRDLDDVNALQITLRDLKLNVNNIKLLPDTYREGLQRLLLQKLKIISSNIFSAEELKKRKEYCMSKLIAKGGEQDWRKSRYVYAISAVIAFLYDIDAYLTQARSMTDTISRYVAFLNNANFVDKDGVNLKTIGAYLEISGNVNEEGDTRLLKQRSERWQELRAEAKVTGSSLFEAIGCDGLQKQKDHFDKVMCGVPKKEHSMEVKAAMEHGIKNEENGVATVVGKVLPVLEPNMIFCEEGCLMIHTQEGKLFMVVSPDGSLRRDRCLSTTLVAIEIKCPVRKVHSEVPARYLLQCLAEIEVLGVQYLLFVSWTEEETTVFKVERDADLFQRAMKIALELYEAESPKRPVKLSDSQKQLKNEIFKKSKRIQTVGRFQSCKARNCDNLYDISKYTTDNLATLLKEINDVTKAYYELTRERASEAVVFLAADLDRGWQKDQIRCAPVSWFPKGYSLASENMRQIAEHVHNRCHTAGLHIPCLSFDGQWHTVVVRSVDGKPLTLLQLQKDVWKKVEKMKKKDIIDEIKDINKNPKWKFTFKEVLSEEGERVLKQVIEVTNDNLILPKYRLVQRPANAKAREDREKEVLCEPSKLADSLPASLRAKDVLPTSAVQDMVEQEIFSCNVNNEEWTNELLEIEDEEVQENLTNTDCDTEHSDLLAPEYQDTTQEELLEALCEESLNQNIISAEDMTCILCLFKTTKDCNKGNKWDSILPTDLLDYFRSVDNLYRFLDVEIRTVVRYLKKTKGLKIKESVTKREKIRSIAAWLRIDTTEKSKTVVIKTVKKHQVNKLAELAVNTLSKKVSKCELNVLYSEYIWPDCYRHWIESVAPITVNGETYHWFYKPEYSEDRHQFEVRCIDSTHLMTRTRRKSCKGGLEGLSNESWLKVAKPGKTFLTPIMVEEITDPMSITMAVTHFSEQVEVTMRRNGDTVSADLCKDIRQWWESEDNPGLKAVERHALRQGLRQRLLSHVNFSSFPPATMNLGGWPLQLWEAIIANIDAKTWLYSLCHGGTYNVRAFSSMIGETFFAELTLNDKRGQGMVSCKDFGQFMGNTVEQVQIRLDPNRTFHYTTSLGTVYNYVDKAQQTVEEHDVSCRVCLDAPDVLPDNISLRDHTFDTTERGRLLGKKKHSTISMERNALQKGALGVRWEKARTNLSKVLPSHRMGVSSSK